MAELNVSRKTIEQTLTDSLKVSTTKRFVIPEYQRPYSWDIEKCDILWNDVVTCFEQNKDNNEEYFLGTIVSCLEDGSIAIIDGQQRLTSFFLLLRAFFSKLEEQHKAVPSDHKLIILMSRVVSCIWDVEPNSIDINDRRAFHINSKVATASDNEVFHSILETGSIVDHKSNYARNYKYFKDQCDNYAKAKYSYFTDLCDFFLKRCIVLPIECKDLDSALTIFSTLNDRGMPLSDSDIFKAELYKLQADDMKEEFTAQWLKLSEILESVHLNLNDIFRYYTHVIRARNDDKSKEVGLRKFYSNNRYERLKESGLVGKLCDLADFWQKILTFDDSICELRSKQMIHCLLCYPNEYWKYPVSVFFFKNRDNLKELLPDFLENLLSYLFAMFVDSQTVNTIKDPIFKACIDVYQNGRTSFTHTIIDFESKMNNLSTSKISKPMILLYAYIHDREQNILPLDFQIEHIFPQKWDTTYINWTKEDAEIYLNKFGNKIVLEKKQNIQASNGFYSRKKNYYKGSSILCVNKLCELEAWDQEGIINRNNEVLKSIKEFLENNLLSFQQSQELLFHVYGGGEDVQIFEVNCLETVSYKLVHNENIINYKTLEDAIDHIDVGLCKYGIKEVMTDSVESILSSK